MADQAQKKMHTVELEQPVVRGEQKIETLTLRKPEAGELRGVSMIDLIKMETTAVLKVLPRITMPNLTDPECAALCPADLFACAVEISDFFMTRQDRAALSTM